jgi:predicted transcriptional regulator
MSYDNTRTVAVEVDQETRDRIERLAQLRHRPLDSLIKDAVSQYLEREENRDRFRHDAIQAWNERQATGLHVSADEVATWLETWGEENEQTAPECHK